MSARLGMRMSGNAAASLRQNFLNPQLRFSAQRRLQSTTTSSSSETAASNQSYFQRLWNSEVGPKTVHFWAPIMKWGVVLAGAADFARPAEQLSISQNAALMCTGLIWTRWCFVIRPQNYFLASVNFLLFTVGLTQVTRVLIYQRSLPAEERAKTELGTIERVAEDPTKLVEAAKGKDV